MSRIGRLLSYCMPVGLARLLEYRQRFAALGLPRGHAWHRPLRAALVTTRIELLPRDVMAGSGTAVDVGANVGAWSCGIAQLMRLRQIIAFEPAPDTFHILCRNTRGYPNIRCVQAAVGRGGPAQVTFFVEPASELSSTRKLTENGRTAHRLAPAATRAVQVPAVTLDEALRDVGEISLLKIDVQGGEMDVLAGARAVLQRTRVLVLEALYRRDYYEGAAIFDELHAHLTATTPLRLWVVSEPGVAPDGTPMWADAVYRAP